LGKLASGKKILKEDKCFEPLGQTLIGKGFVKSNGPQTQGLWKLTLGKLASGKLSLETRFRETRFGNSLQGNSLDGNALGGGGTRFGGTCFWELALKTLSENSL
jgi:hypothetical protein